ncbi:ABC-three component system protein [Aeromonas veronii]
MTTIDVLFRSDEEDRQLREENPNTPDLFAFDCGQLPFERMGDAHFELLLADLYTARTEDGSEGWYDEARRLNDGADQGRDVILLDDSAPVGVIQCKRYNGIVSLDMVIQEICKFFLYATIKPGIASAPGEPFRYYVAVSDRASGKLFDFMTGKGRQRFEDLRAKFEEKALAARKGSATLRKHDALKNLTQAQLCDVVWAWIDNLHTGLHKKDDLSRLVGAYPHIKSTYFKLESDSAKIVDELKAFLQLHRLKVSDEDEGLISGIRTEYIKLKLGRNQRFNLGLLQGAELLPFMRSMLQPKTGRLFNNFGSLPVIFTGGAEVAEPGDWAELHHLVDTYDSQAVVFIGCGGVTGAQLADWKNSDDMVWIDPNWDPAPLQRYRAGWCWVKDPSQGIFNCYVLVENETGEPGYGHGEVSLRLAFEDVVVWPTLGNDFTNPISNARSQLRRIMTSQKEDRSQRPNLVLASISVTSLEKVLTSVSDHYGQRTYSTIATAIANSNRIVACPTELYSATGIFPAIDAELATRATPATVNPPGCVMRRSTVGALTFTLNWTVELAITAVKAHRLFEGAVTDDMQPVSLEFHELFDRYPPFPGYLPAVKTELDLLNNLVQSAGLPDDSGFTYRTLFGVRAGEDYSLEALSKSGENVMRTVQALSYLNVPPASQWGCSPDQQGHIRHDDPVHGEVNLMAWSNKNYPARQIEGDLFDWARQPGGHPSLIVFAQGRGNITDKKLSDGRYDYTSPPAPKGSITEPAIARSVYMFNLGDIESVYDDPRAPSPDQFMKDIFVRKGKLDAQ